MSLLDILTAVKASWREHEEPRPDPDDYFSAMAQLVATRATCLRRAVGCVLVDHLRHVVATGYNGVAAGLPHCNQRVDEEDGPDERGPYPFACAGAAAASGTQLDACEAIHAEQNALLQCRDVQQIWTCYCTTAPCLTCVKLLLNTSCRRIVFAEDYPHAAAAMSLWKRAGRVWVRYLTSGPPAGRYARRSRHQRPQAAHR